MVAGLAHALSPFLMPRALCITVSSLLLLLALLGHLVVVARAARGVACRREPWGAAFLPQPSPRSTGHRQDEEAEEERALLLLGAAAPCLLTPCRKHRLCPGNSAAAIGPAEGFRGLWSAGCGHRDERGTEKEREREREIDRERA